MTVSGMYYLAVSLQCVLVNLWAFIPKQDLADLFRYKQLNINRAIITTGSVYIQLSQEAMSLTVSQHAQQPFINTFIIYASDLEEQLFLLETVTLVSERHKKAYFMISLYHSRGTTAMNGAGFGIDRPAELTKGDDEYDAFRKRMMLAYRFRPNPLVTSLLCFLTL